MKSKTMCISCILAALFCVRAANADVVITVDQVGPNVVATGSGTINTSALTLSGAFTVFSSIDPNFGGLDIGPAGGLLSSTYAGASGPTSFGSGGSTLASSGTGNLIGVFGFTHEIDLPRGYISGTPLSGTATWNSTTLGALGATPGTFTWRWGSGANADSLTVVITPEPSSLALLGPGLIGLAGRVRRKLKR